MTREPVESSNIAAIGYDPETRTLEIAFKAHPVKGAVVWAYSEVAPHEHYDLVTAESIGRAFGLIKSSKPARKVAIVDVNGVEHAIEETVAS